MSEIKVLAIPGGRLPIPNAVIHNGLVYVSGQAPVDADGRATTPDFKDQVRETLGRIDGILAQAGTSKDRAIMVRVYLADVQKDFPAMNEVYRQWIGEHRPARTTIGAVLADASLKVEIDLIAAVE